jgi:hypothetical protein
MGLEVRAGASSGTGFNKGGFFGTGFLGFSVEKCDHLFVGLKRAVRIAPLSLFQGFR